MKPRKVELEVHVDTSDAEAAIEDLLDLVRELRAEIEAVRAAWPTPGPNVSAPFSWTCSLCGGLNWGNHVCPPWTYNVSGWTHQVVYSERPVPDVSGRDLLFCAVCGKSCPCAEHPHGPVPDIAAEVMRDPLNPKMSAVEFWDKILGHRCQCAKPHYGRVRLVLDGDRYRVAEPPMIPWSADWDELAGMI